MKYSIHHEMQTHSQETNQEIRHLLNTLGQHILHVLKYVLTLQRFSLNKVGLEY